MNSCKECGAYHGHSPLCSHNSYEELKEHLKVYFEEYQKQAKEIDKFRKIYRNFYDSHKTLIKSLQGRLAIVKIENNALRKKIANR